MKIKLLIVFFCGLFAACSENNGFRTVGGLKGRFHEVAFDGRKPEPGNFLKVYMKLYLSEQEIIYNSIEQQFKGIDIIKVGNAIAPGGLEEGLLNLRVGDSVSFFLSADQLFGTYLKQAIPDAMTEETEVEVVLRLLEVQNYIEYQQAMTEAKDEAELFELKQINSVLATWSQNGDTVHKVGDVYGVFEPSNGSPVKYDQLIKVDYSAEFLDGTVFYSTLSNHQPDEFQVGRTGQTTEGFKQALMSMKHGQRAKFLVPSYVGFGESPAVAGIVKPFSPILYYIQVLEN